jgi:hypothetical protein
MCRLQAAIGAAATAPLQLTPCTVQLLRVAPVSCNPPEREWKHDTVIPRRHCLCIWCKPACTPHIM